MRSRFRATRGPYGLTESGIKNEARCGFYWPAMDLMGDVWATEFSADFDAGAG